MKLFSSVMLMLTISFVSLIGCDSGNGCQCSTTESGRPKNLRTCKCDPCKCTAGECGANDCSLRQEFTALYDLVSRNNATQYQIMDAQIKSYHYIAGHNYREPFRGCTECGLLRQLEKRKTAIENETLEVQGKINDSQGSPDPALKARIQELAEEYTLLEQHLYRADKRAGEVSKIMKPENGKPQK